MRRWTEDMEAYLEKSWGSISTKKLAQNLNVTEAAVKNKACKMGLGSMLSNKDFLIAKELESLLGTDRKTIRKNINERGLKAKEVKLTSANRKYIAIKYDDLVEWLENNTKFWNAAKADILALKALGVDPDLLNKKYKEDVEKFNRRNIDEETLNKIKEYYLKGYTYEDISKLVNMIDKSILEKKFAYNSNKLLEINFMNCVQTEDTNLNKFLNKKKSRGKIDLIFALIDALYLLQQEVVIGDECDWSVQTC